MDLRNKSILVKKFILKTGSKIFGIKRKEKICLLIFFLGIGLFLRLLLIPFLTHGDLLRTYSKAIVFALQGRIYNSNFGFFWLSLHALPVKIFSLFTPALKEGLIIKYNMDPFRDSLFYSHLGSRILFIFKFPFLIFELLSGILAIRLLDKEREKIKFWIFWMLNPIMIFTLYIHGRNEAAPIFFLALSFLLMKKKKLALSFLSLGMAMTLRLYAIFFLPVYFLKISKKLGKKIIYLGLALTPLLADLAIMRLFKDNSFFSVDKIHSIPEVFFTANLELGMTQKASILIAILVGFYLWLVVINNQAVEKWQTFFNLSFLSILPWFSLGFIHPQYFAWLSLFFGIFIARNKKMVFPYLVYCFSWLLIIIDFGRSFTWSLFKPIDVFIFGNISTTPETVWYRMFPDFSLNYLARSIMLGSFLFIFIFRNKLYEERR